MIYMKSFHLPTIDEEENNNLTPREYPYGIFPFKELRDIYFDPVTIFYGSNGSGKSTLLNIIAEKLKISRSTLFHTSPKFKEYVDSHCNFSMDSDEEGFPLEIPLRSKIITSEDIFDNILAIREENQMIDKRKLEEEKKYWEARSGAIRFSSLDDYEMLKEQNQARRKTKKKFVTDRVGTNIKQFSNGETSLAYFDKVFESNQIYLLDEPENSLSPTFQLQLSELILQCSRYLGCQFIIASHSPFILSMESARIYDLDVIPATPRPWYRLENMMAYYNFFKEHEYYFKK